MSSDSTPPKIHINPNFIPRLTNSSQVHVNPNFQPKHLQKANIHVNPDFAKSKSTHPNPNLANRPLPQTPKSAQAHLNPKFFQPNLPRTPKDALDPSRQRDYDLHVKQSVNQKVLVNPNFSGKPKFVPSNENEVNDNSKQRDIHTMTQKILINPNFKVSPVTALDHQDITESSKQVNSVLKKKKNVVLVNPKFRVKAKVNAEKENDSPPMSPAKKKMFKKIGTKKLIRVREKKLLSSNNRSQDSPDLLVYNLKQNKNLDVTPQRKNFILRLVSTPFSLRRKKKPWLSLTQPRNPFKLDRRICQKQKSTLNSQESNKNPKNPPPPKPARTTKASTVAKKARETVINIDGKKFKVSEHGRKLCRIPDEMKGNNETPVKPARTTVPKNNSHRLNRKLFLEGEEYEEKEPGVLVISRNSMTRQSITNARNKSINTILKSQTRSKQYCMFFNKFGKCTKKEKGVCPYIHDKDKIAVCRKFLRGDCQKEDCLLSHRIAPEKMPACKFFLEGICIKENCPYRHVKVNPDAQICPDYLKGFCPVGSDCKKRHVSKCPQFEKTGVCSKGKRCPYPHKPKDGVLAKKLPPAKPKRKSLCKAQEEVNKKVPSLRYFEVEKEEEDSAKNTEDNQSPKDNKNEAFEAKRRRLMKKIELAKQGWSGIAVTVVEDKKECVQNLDDSGPYEEIEEEKYTRPELGELPSFIPLEESAKDEQDVDENSFQERLI